MKSSFIGEILHFNGTRIRLNGSGNLKLYLRSLDNINSNQLSSISMLPLTNREPTVLANFIDQRGQLEVRITDRDETFTISRIILFIRPIASEFPR